MKCETLFLREGRSDVTLTAYLLDCSPELPGSKTRPAVIICPGGAYLSCSDREGEPVALAFAAMGYHAFVLRYGVWQEGRPGFPAPGSLPEPKAHCIHPEPMLDLARAMAAIRDRAEAWCVDRDRIAVCGFSAGAHNAAMYATHWQEELISARLSRPAEEFRPAACILGYTLSDYNYLSRCSSASADPFVAGLFSASNVALLGTPNPDAAVLDAVSPALHITEHTPPTFLWATAEDSLVPVQHTLIMARALADKRIPFEVHVFEKGPHGLSTATQAAASARSECRPEVAQWLPMCAHWLEQRFALELPELTVWEKMALK